MKKIKILSICFFLGLITYGQDVHFVQTSSTPILINPAATGVFQGWERVSLAHRQQWFTIGAPYMTSQISADINLFKQVQDKQKAHMGVGINFYNDIAGDGKLGTNQGSLLVSGIVNIAENQTLSAGLEIGAAQQSIKMQNLTWGSQFDGEGFDSDIVPGEGNSAATLVYADMGAGIFYNMQNVTSTMARKEVQRLYAGVSYYHLTTPSRQFYNGSVDKLNAKLVGQVGAEMDIPNSKFVFAPSVVYINQGPNNMILGTLAGKFRIKEGTKYTGIYNNTYLNFGLTYRSKDAIAPIIGLELANYRLGLAYEFNVSPLQSSTNSQGSFEITFQWANFQTALFQGRRTKGFKKPGGM